MGGQSVWKTNLNVERHSYYGSRWTAPFDEHFHLVLNVAIGGWFLEGPDEHDVWTYPEAQLEVDSVTVWPLEHIVDQAQTQCSTSSSCNDCQPDTDECSGTNSYLQYVLKDGTYEASCVADMNLSVQQQCGSMKWFCYDPGAQAQLDQTVAGGACHADRWSTIGCCYTGDGSGCEHDAVGADLTDV